MRCLHTNKNDNSACREEAKEYLACRMENNLMAKEEWSKLDSDEWAAWSKRGDPVLHIELAKWADIFLIAPLDANTLAKISNGLCDNLVTCTVRAWEISKPLIFCPAMNTKMFQHPLTSSQITILKSWGYLEIPVIEKVLICGDTGPGAMAEVSTIVEFLKDLINKQGIK
ncbi:hypothetical protein NQ314_009499 [Rhamnusium bicolor]|uniref:Flavoprotein domain-containing protein n=1 Tax=Rhamnusium bicolor TaxID=1586634 RepID=A0AAV8XZ14_9CUCU|nr:hypothetical protein NQ314_009499 [Rhamnusium bicolor]